jgi:hypothetical protein
VCVFAGSSGEKGNQEFAWLDAGTSGEWIVGDDCTKLADRAKDDYGTAGECFFYSLLETFGHPCEVTLGSFEDDVAALDVSLWFLEFQRDAEVPQRIHFDFGVAANVDTAQERDQNGHGQRQVTTTAGSGKRQKSPDAGLRRLRARIPRIWDASLNGKLRWC